MTVSGIGWPSYDFEVVLHTSGAASFTASKVTDDDGNETLTNCKQGDDAIIVIAEDHGLPCGVLRGDLICYVPDDDYEDGIRKHVVHFTPGLVLVVGASDDDDAVTCEVALPSVVAAALTLLNELGDFDASTVLSIADSLSSVVETLQTDEATLADVAAKLVTDEASVSETAEKLATDETTLSEKVTDLSTAISDVQAAVDGLDTESIQTAVTEMANWGAVASDIYEFKSALAAAFNSYYGWGLAADDSFADFLTWIKTLGAVDESGTKYLMFETSAADTSVQLTYRAQYFTSIIIDDEELQDGSATGALTYTFASTGLHVVGVKLDTSLTDLSYAFYNCTALKYVSSDLFAENTAVTSFVNTFYGCSSLSSIPEGLFATNTAVTNFQYTFQSCSSLSSIDVQAQLAKVTTMSNMCNGCSGALVITLIGLGTQSSCTTSSAFSGCTNWGASDDGLQSLIDTLYTNSYDRATAGFDALTITLPETVYNRLSEDEIETITAKGFTLAY